MASLPNILLILAAISIGATVIAVLIAFRSQREAQAAIFPIVREEESIKAQRARLAIFVWVAITALFLGGWLATFRLTISNDTTTEDSDTVSDQSVEAVALEPATETPLPIIEPSPTPPSIETETQQPAPELLPTETLAPLILPTVTPTSLPEPTQPPPATPTPEPTLTFTPTPLPATPTLTSTPLPPTVTPTETSTSVPPTVTPTPTALIIKFPTTPPPRTPAPPETRVGPIQFATEITPDLEAVNPNDTFPNGVEIIYAVYPVRGMQKGLNFKVIWYQNGVEVAREDGQWQWPTETRSYTFIGPSGEGLYKLELYVNDSIVATNLFEVRELAP